MVPGDRSIVDVLAQLWKSAAVGEIRPTDDVD
jgi:hypothetical protein